MVAARPSRLFRVRPEKETSVGRDGSLVFLVRGITAGSGAPL
jgi:hypothetical protein